MRSWNSHSVRRHIIGVIVFTLLTVVLVVPPSDVQAETSAKCPGENGYQWVNGRKGDNPRKGGFVSDSANVDEEAFIAPTSAICGSASILGYVRIYGNAVVAEEAEISGKARVYGNARVSGTAVVSGEAKVSGHAHVSGDAIVEGITWVRGYKEINSGHFSEGTYTAEKSAQQKQAEQEDLNKQKEEFEWLVSQLNGNRWGGLHVLKDAIFDYQWSDAKAISPCKIQLQANHTKRNCTGCLSTNPPQCHSCSNYPDHTLNGVVEIDISKSSSEVYSSKLVSGQHLYRLLGDSHAPDHFPFYFSFPSKLAMSEYENREEAYWKKNCWKQ